MLRYDVDCWYNSIYFFGIVNSPSLDKYITKLKQLLAKWYNTTLIDIEEIIFKYHHKKVQSPILPYIIPTNSIIHFRKFQMQIRKQKRYC